MYYLDKDYITEFSKAHSYPDMAFEAFDEAIAALNKTGFSEAFEALCAEYMAPEEGDRDKALGEVKRISEASGVNEYTLTLLYLICCSKRLREKYAEKGIPEQIFFDTMEDLRCKLIECIECEGVAGTFVGGWFHGFYCLNRFALGRFQYERSALQEDYTCSAGTFKKGTPCLGFHIPSSGISLTDDVRLDSYRRIYNFDYFKDYIQDGKLVLECGSWLLYPRHREFLPENSNILRFMSDFDIVSSEEKDEFSDGWRVFGRDSDLPVEQLPDNTTLRRVYKQWLLKTGKSGHGHGIIVFDGEKIVNR